MSRRYTAIIKKEWNVHFTRAGAVSSSASEVKLIADVWNPNCFIEHWDTLQIQNKLFIVQITTWSMKIRQHLFIHYLITGTELKICFF